MNQDIREEPWTAVRCLEDSDSGKDSDECGQNSSETTGQYQTSESTKEDST